MCLYQCLPCRLVYRVFNLCVFANCVIRILHGTQESPNFLTSAPYYSWQTSAQVEAIDFLVMIPATWVHHLGEGGP
jgi:hypothetical protein